MKQTLAVLFIAIDLAGTTACTSLQVAPMQENPAQSLAVKVGEHVRVTGKDGQRKEFEVTELETDTLVGRDIRVSYQDIALLEVRRFDTGKTVAVVSIVAGALLLLWVAAASAGAYSSIMTY